MLKLDVVKKNFEHLNLSAVSREIGEPYYKLRHALVANNPPYNSVEILSDYLEGRNNLVRQRRIAEQRLNDPKYADAAADVIDVIDGRAENDKSD